MAIVEGPGPSRGPCLSTVSSHLAKAPHPSLAHNMEGSPGGSEGPERGQARLRVFCFSWSALSLYLRLTFF